MKKTLTIRIEEEQLEKLKKLAKAEDRSIGAIIRIFIEAGFNKKELMCQKKLT